MPPLDIKDAITVITGIVTLTGVFFTMRASVAANAASVGRLESGQTETLRQLGALHKRLDHHGERITKTERDQAVLQAVLHERTGLRESQRFRLRAAGEAAQAGQPPMFGEGDE